MRFWMRADEWRTEEDLVLQCYPYARWRTLKTGVKKTRQWQLWMRPIPEEALSCVLADIAIGVEVQIGANGRIQHSPNCPQSVSSHTKVLPELRLHTRSYLVDLIYPWFRGTADLPAHPKARVIRPEISARTFPGHPHLYSANGGASWACPLSPQSTSWSWVPGATVAYLDQVAIWILKSEVWMGTGGNVGEFGQWLGPDTSHDALIRLSETRTDRPCWCGAPQTYGDCHKRVDEFAAVTKLLREVERAGQPVGLGST